MVGRVGTGDQSLTTLLSRQSASLRAELQLRGSELTTGQHADLTKAVGGDFSALAAIDHSLARLRGYTSNTTEARLFTDVMQNALQVMSDAAGDLGTNILRNVGMATETGINALTIDAARQFETTVGVLNTRFSERAVFSGVNADTTPLPDAETLLAALDVAVSGAATVSDAQIAIETWFADPTGYQALYAGGDPRADVPVAPGEMAELSVTALDPAIRDTLKALASVALLGRGLFTGNLSARASITRAAGEDLMAGGEGRSHLMARLGAVQAQVEAASTRNTAETSALTIARAQIVTADPYETATRLEDLQSRLESLYLITSRLSRLSLTEYLR